MNEEIKQQINDCLDQYCKRTNTPMIQTVSLAEDLLALILQERAAGRTEAIKEVRKLLPEEIDMRIAVGAGSDAGAGNVIGHNSCLKDVIYILDKVEGKKHD